MKLFLNTTNRDKIFAFAMCITIFVLAVEFHASDTPTSQDVSKSHGWWDQEGQQALAKLISDGKELIKIIEKDGLLPGVENQIDAYYKELVQAQPVFYNPLVRILKELEPCCKLSGACDWDREFRGSFH